VVFDEESFPLAASPQQPVPMSTTPSSATSYGWSGSGGACHTSGESTLDDHTG
jgi:hypothetical protein